MYKYTHTLTQLLLIYMHHVIIENSNKSTCMYLTQHNIIKGKKTKAKQKLYVYDDACS